MKKDLVTISLIAIVFGAYSQANEGTLRMEKTFWGAKFYENSRILKPKEVLQRMTLDEEAYSVFKKAKSNYDASQVLSLAGGFLIGWPVGTALGGGDSQWGLAAGGAGLLLIAIPLNSAFNKHAKNAIKIYNRGSDSVSSKRHSVTVVPLGTGAKVALKF